MSFEYFEYLYEKNQFDEIQIIDRAVESQGRPYYFLAMVRKGDQVQVCVLAQTKPWAGCFAMDQNTMRQNMKASLMWAGSAVDMSKIEINGQVLEIGGGQFQTLGEGSPECMAFLEKLAEAGWKMPKDHVFYQMEWNSIELSQAEVRTPPARLPDWKNADICVTWAQQAKGYCIEKPLKLMAVSQKKTESEAGSDAESNAGSAAEPKVETDAESDVPMICSGQGFSFSMTDQDGIVKNAVCYVNSVTLIDMWAEYDQQFADPEYQKKAREHVSEEQFEDMKQDLYRALEQECPRGMCFFGIEYECECEADLTLEFYAAEYLESSPAVHHGGATVYLSTSKPSKEIGDHGLKLRACVIRTPAAPDTKELCVELFSAHEMIPEREEVFAGRKSDT